MESEQPAGAMPIIFASIVKRLCITATWNRDPVVLAPHIAYLRHGEPHIDAVVVSRNNMLPRETKIGTFKVSGLGKLALSQRPFELFRQFEPQAERYAEATLMAVETEAATA
jgi:hypothetical protein